MYGEGYITLSRGTKVHKELITVQRVVVRVSAGILQVLNGAVQARGQAVGVRGGGLERAMRFEPLQQTEGRRQLGVLLGRVLTRTRRREAP